METEFSGLAMYHYLCPNKGDMLSMNGYLHVCVDGRSWTKVKDLPVQPDHCLYCGSTWNEDTFHPGTCCNCGAGALLGTTNV